MEEEAYRPARAFGKVSNHPFYEGDALGDAVVARIRSRGRGASAVHRPLCPSKSPGMI